jgi:hypothetical protein
MIRLLRSIQFTPLLHTRVSQSLVSISLGIVKQLIKCASFLVFTILIEEFYLPVRVNIMAALKFKFNIFLYLLFFVGSRHLFDCFRQHRSQKPNDPLWSVTMVHD